jgi:hypothetical protein
MPTPKTQPPRESVEKNRPLRVRSKLRAGADEATFDLEWEVELVRFA